MPHDGIDDYLDQFVKPKQRGDGTVARTLDDEFSKLGYGDPARLSILGDVGRENSWDRNTIFKGHTDPKNKRRNRGIISWQGERADKLDAHLKSEGVYGRGDDEELRGMARFMDKELREDFPDIHKRLLGAKNTSEASEALRKYIKYVPTAPYNSPDPDFRVKNNADWAKQAKSLGLAQKGLDDYLDQFIGTPAAVNGLDKMKPVSPTFPAQAPAPSVKPELPKAPAEPEYGSSSAVGTLTPPATPPAPVVAQKLQFEDGSIEADDQTGVPEGSKRVLSKDGRRLIATPKVTKGNRTTYEARPQQLVAVNLAPGGIAGAKTANSDSDLIETDPNAPVKVLHYSPNKPDNVEARSWMEDDIAAAAEQEFNIPFAVTKSYLKDKGINDRASGQQLDDFTLANIYQAGDGKFTIDNQMLDELIARSDGYNVLREAAASGLPETEWYEKLRGRGFYSDEQVDAMTDQAKADRQQLEEQVLAEEKDKAVADFTLREQRQKFFIPQADDLSETAFRKAAKERINQILATYKTPANYFAAQKVEQDRLRGLKARRDEMMEMGQVRLNAGRYGEVRLGGVSQFTVPLQVLSNIAQAAVQMGTDAVAYTDVLKAALYMPSYGDMFESLTTGKAAFSPAYKRSAYMASQALQKWFENNTYNDDYLNTSVFLNDIPKAVTQMVGQIALGAVTGGAAAGTLSGMSQGAMEQYKAAVEGGATEDQLRVIVAVASAAAVPEFFIQGGMLHSAGLIKSHDLFDLFLKKTARQLYAEFAASAGEAEARELTKESLKGILARVAKAGGQYAKYGTYEALQETSEQKTNDAVAYYTYDRTNTRWNKVRFLTQDDLRTIGVSFVAGASGQGFGNALARLARPSGKIVIDGKEYDTPDTARPILRQALAQYQTALDTWENATTLFDASRKQKTQEQRREYRQAARNAYERGVLEFQVADQFYAGAQEAAAGTSQYLGDTGLVPMMPEDVLRQAERRKAATERREAKGGFEGAPDITGDYVRGIPFNGALDPEQDQTTEQAPNNEANPPVSQEPAQVDAEPLVSDQPNESPRPVRAVTAADNAESPSAPATAQDTEQAALQNNEAAPNIPPKPNKPAKPATAQTGKKQQEMFVQGIQLDSKNGQQQQTSAPPSTPASAASEMEQARKDGQITKDGVTYNRNPDLRNLRKKGSAGTVRFGTNESRPYEWRLIEADDLQPAHLGGNINYRNFIPEAQPKDRTEQVSQETSDAIAANPDFEQVAENSVAYFGAPVVNRRGEVIQGNNRSEGLKKHYAQGGTAYRQKLAEAAARFGFTANDVSQMKEPVLVRMLSEASDAEAIHLGNMDAQDMESGGTQRVNPVKTAAKIPHEDKARILEVVFKDAGEDETLNALIRAKEDKIAPLLAPHLNATQYQSLLNPEKKFTPQAIEDIADLFTHFLFEKGGRLLPQAFANLSYTTREGIIASLPKIFSVPRESSLVRDLQNAIIAANQFAAAGSGDFATWSRQPDMFSGSVAPQEIYTPVELELAHRLHFAKTQRAIKDPFAAYAKAANGSEQSLFEEATPGLAKADAIKQVFGVDYEERPYFEQESDDSADGGQSEERSPAETAETEPKSDEENVAQTFTFEPIAENRDKFFKPFPADSTEAEYRMVPVDKLKQTQKPDPEDSDQIGADRSLQYIRNVDEGVKGAEPRRPLLVRENGDGTYDILDGNATHEAATRLGWKELPVQIVPADMPTTLTYDGITVNVDLLDLDHDGLVIQNKTVHEVLANPKHWLDLYDKHKATKGGFEVNSDHAKELFPEYNYDPLSRAGAVHAASSLIADLQYRLKLREMPPNSRILFLAGGGGSGKGYALKTALANEHYDLVLDGVMKTAANNEASIKLALDAGHVPFLVAVFTPAARAAEQNVRRSTSSRRLVGAKPITKGHEGFRRAFSGPTHDFAQANNISIRFLHNTGAAEPTEITYEEFTELVHNEDGKIDSLIREAAYAEIEQGQFRGKPYDPRLRDAFDGKAIQTVDTRTASDRKEIAGRPDAETDRGDRPGEQGTRVPRLRPPPKDTPVTLVFGGSFSPIHTGHIDVLEAAKGYMEREGYTVANVVLAPSADRLLRKKLGDDTIPLEQRAEMARLTTAGMKGVTVATGPGIEAENFPKDKKLKRTQLADWAAKEFPGTSVVNVTGADQPVDGTPEDKSSFPVAYTGAEGSSHAGYYYLSMPREEEGPNAKSSSFIRKSIQEGTALPEGYMHPAAEKFYKKYLADKGSAATQPRSPQTQGGTQQSQPDTNGASVADIVRKRLEAEQAKAAKAKAENDALSALNDVFGLGMDLDSGDTEEQKSAVAAGEPPAQAAFDPTRYAAAKNAFDQALAAFPGGSVQESVDALIDNLLSRNVPLEKIVEMEPYIVRYIEDKSLQSGGKPDITDAEADNDTTSDTGSDRPDSSGEPLSDNDSQNASDLAGGERDGVEQSGQDGPVGPDGQESDAESGHGTRPESGASESNGERLGDTSDGRSAPATDNFEISDELNFERFSPKARFRSNVEAIRLVQQLEKAERRATSAEQKILAGYIGWGGLKQAFDPNNEKWSKEYAELKELLPEDEYEGARASVLNAHYTSKEVVNAIWSGVQRLGFNRGYVLEPSMGTGNFFGLMPKSLRGDTALTGVELEPLTSKIAKHLYPRAEIFGQRGFEDTYIVPESIDLAIGNPPFGDEHVFDRNDRTLSRFRIHAYFFAKSINTVRPGGVLAMVVSHGFMDSRAPEANEARRYIADRARLLGAIRLPDTAFQANANTEVTTDIIFLQKYDPENGIEPQEGDRQWVGPESVVDRNTGDRIPVSKYFADHPEMMLGDMTLAGTMYGPGQPTLTARPDTNLEAELAKAIERLPEGVFTNRTDEITQRLTDAVTKTADDYKGLRPFNFGVSPTGGIFQLVVDMNGIATERELKLGAKAIERAKGMIEIRQTIREILTKESRIDTTDSELEPLRARLNRQYDGFQKKYGYISAAANKQVMREDADYPLLAALEKDFDKGVSAAVAKNHGIEAREPFAKKADIFTKRTISPVRKITKVENANDALLASLNHRGNVDLHYMSQLYGKPQDAVINELGDQIYNDPEQDRWVTSSEYLSGDVKTKLEKAKVAALENPDLNRNVEALEKVIPADKQPVDIFVKLGASWVPTDVYKQFIADLIDGDFSGQYNPTLGRFVGLRITSRNSTLNNDRWGVPAIPSTNTTDGKPGMSAAAIIKGLLENKFPTIRVPKKDEDGHEIFTDSGVRVYVVDEEQTAAAQGKAEEIIDEFQDWIWRERERRQQVAAIYNEKFNRRVKRTFDGSHLELPGLKAGENLRPHIKNFVYRGLQTGKVLADHVVGAGKTPASVTLAMEMRRLGQVKKPMFVVPNHLVEQWQLEFKKFYPGANVLAAGKKDFEKGKRRELFAKIATGDWDAVIVAHSSFGFIQVPTDVERGFIREQIQEMQEAIDEARRQAGKGDRSVREMEKALKRLRDKMARLNDRSRDTLLDFAEMGVDALFVDEAHEFKNLYFITQKQGVGSLGDTKGSQKAFDMFMKTQMILRKHNDRNVVFLTGTPVSNSLSEIYHMQRYMQYDTLKKAGIASFDSWANTFGQDVQDWELDASNRFRQKLRFTHFSNLGELRQLWHEVADIVSNEDIKQAALDRGEQFPIPHVNRIRVTVPRSPEQAAYIGIPQFVFDAEGNPVIDPQTQTQQAEYLPGTIIYRMENWKKIRAEEDPKENVLRITTHARQAGLDIRMINEHAPDFPESKLNAATDRILKEWKDNDYRKGTQLVFLDLSTPKAKRSDQPTVPVVDAEDVRDETLADEEVDLDDYFAQASNFSAYDELRSKLIAKGMPAEQIAFIHDYNTDLQKAELFGKVNRGEIRVLFGSTKKMGAGTNVQKKLVALHNIDVPWKPSDLQQRIGRIERQGNEFWTPEFTVNVYDYATEKTYDARMWEINEVKGVAIDRFRFSDDDTLEDISPESANAAEMKAAAAGDPRILESIKLQADIKKLAAQKRSFDRSKFDLQDKIALFESGDSPAHRQLAKITAADTIIKANPKTEDTPISIGGNGDFLTVTNRDLGWGLSDEEKAAQNKDEKAKEAVAAKRDEFSRKISSIFLRSLKTHTRLQVGKYRGFNVVLAPSSFEGGGGRMYLVIGGTTGVQGDFQGGDPIASTDFVASEMLAPPARGVMRRIVNMTERLPEFKAEAERSLERMEKEAAVAKDQLAAPFPKLKELEDKRTRHAEILQELRAQLGGARRSARLLDDEATDGDAMTLEEMQSLPFVPIDELLTGGTDVDVLPGGVIKANAKSQEIYRRAFEQRRINANKTVPGAKDAESLFAGVFQEPTHVGSTVKVLRDKAAEALALGYPKEQADVFTQHADALEQAGKDSGDGTAVIYVFASALPHELFHRADYTGAIDKHVLNRHSSKSQQVLDAHPIRTILYEKHFAKFPEYRRSDNRPTTILRQNAILRSEIPPYLLEKTADELAAMGITQEMVDDYLLTWFEGYAEKNGIDALKNFEAEQLYVESYIEKAKAAVTDQQGQPQNGGTREGNGADTGEQGQPPGEKVQTPAGPGSDSGPAGTSGRMKPASLPKTLTKAGLEADEFLYEVFGDRAAKEAALALIDKYGVPGTISFLEDQKNLDVDHAMASFIIQRMLLDRSEEVRQTDPEEADKLRDLSRSLARDHSLKAIAAGRFTRAAAVIQNSVEGVQYTVESLLLNKYGTSRTLSPAEWDRVLAEGRALEEAVAKIDRLAKDKANLQAQVRRLKDDKETKRRRRHKTSQKNRAKLVDLVKAKKQSTVDSIRERVLEKLSNPDLKSVLRSKSGNIGQFDTLDAFRNRLAAAKRSELPGTDAQDAADVSEPETLKSPVPADTGFDDETLDDLAQVGAMFLIEGLAGDADYLPSTFKAEMVAEFGDAILPQFDEIYRRSWAQRNKWLNEIRYQVTKERIENKYNDGEELDDWEIADILGQEKEKAARRRAIERLHAEKAKEEKPNRELDAYKRIIADIAGTTEEALAAEMFALKMTANEMARRFTHWGITDEKQVRKLTRKGAAIFEEVKKQRAVEKDAIANEVRKLEGEITTIDDARWIARGELKDRQQTVADELRRINNGEFRYRMGQFFDVLNAMRTMMASMDMSASLRQGGFFVFSNPLLQKEAFANMFKSIGEKGFGRAVMEIERSGSFLLAQRSGVDFAVAGKMDDNSMMGEELFRGDKTIEHIPIIGPLVAAGVVKWSERTYTAFLDTQRIVMFDIMARELMDEGLTFQSHPQEFRKIADFINAATGRGNIPSAKFAKMLMNLPLFAPRYTLSRFQLLNMTINPVAYYNMPPHARKIIARKAFRFYGTTMGILGLITAFGAAIGASVNWDDDDPDFLKISIGGQKFDILGGQLPTARLLIRLIHAAYRGNRVPGEFMHEMMNMKTGEFPKFIRGKLSPLAGLTYDVISGTDYNNQETQLVTHTSGGWPLPGKAIYSRLIPLIISDVIEAGKLDGWTGATRAGVGTFFGVGVSSYPNRPEGPQTEAEKLAGSIMSMRLSGKTNPQTAEDKENRKLIDDLTARSRKFEDVSAEADAALRAGKITETQKRNILAAATKSYIEDKAEGLTLDEFAAVYRVATPAERERLKYLLNKKMKNADVEGTLKPDKRRELEALGGRIPGYVEMPDAVRAEFDELDISTPDVGESLTVRKGGPKTSLDADRYEKYRSEVLGRIYNKVSERIATPEYRALPPEERKREIDKIMRKQRSIEQKETKGEIASVN